MRNIIDLNDLRAFESQLSQLLTELNQNIIVNDISYADQSQLSINMFDLTSPKAVYHPSSNNHNNNNEQQAPLLED